MIAKISEIIKYIINSSFAFKAHFAASFITLAAAMYLSTGTLSPYANTVDYPPDYPRVEPKCHYLYNGDYYNFSALFRLLDGKPKSEWEFSVVLRRILYNVMAYPFMKAFEHDLGGIIFNALLTFAAFICFVVFSLRRTGPAGTVAGMWLLALYPGITYYSGQPFLYAIIIPGYLWLYMLLCKMHENHSVKSLWILSLCMGLLFTGYDFLPVFGTAAIIMLVAGKKSGLVPVAIIGMLSFTYVWWAILRFGFNTSFASENSVIYKNILLSYFHPGSMSQWASLLSKLPGVLFSVFFSSCFIMIPLLFVATIFITGKKPGLVDICCIVPVALIFFINNCSPSFDYKWQMRGDGIARIYQPVFVVFLFYITRAVQDVVNGKYTLVKRRILLIALVVTILGNGAVVFGPVFNDPCGISSSVYWRFYKHSPQGTMK